MKTCMKCLIEKPKSDFGSHARKKDGLNSTCLLCARKQSKEFHQKNPEAAYKTHLKVKYNLNYEQYLALSKAQNNACGICKKINKRLVVDHNHKTKQVRGLLCDGCNLAIGFLKLDEGTMILVDVAMYLTTRHEALFCA